MSRVEDGTQVHRCVRGFDLQPGGRGVGEQQLAVLLSESFSRAVMLWVCNIQLPEPASFARSGPTPSVASWEGKSNRDP